MLYSDHVLFFTLLKNAELRAGNSDKQATVVIGCKRRPKKIIA